MGGSEAPVQKAQRAEQGASFFAKKIYFLTDYLPGG